MAAAVPGRSLKRRASAAANWQAIFRTATVFVVVGAVWLLFASLSPFFFTTDNLLNLSIQASNIAVIAAGLTVVLITAEIDLSIGAVQALAGSVAGVLIVQQGVPVALGIPAVLVLGTLVGILNGLVAWKLQDPVVHRNPRDARSGTGRRVPPDEQHSDQRIPVCLHHARDRSRGRDTGGGLDRTRDSHLPACAALLHPSGEAHFRRRGKRGFGGAVRDQRWTREADRARDLGFHGGDRRH